MHKVFFLLFSSFFLILGGCDQSERPSKRFAISFTESFMKPTDKGRNTAVFGIFNNQDNCNLDLIKARIDGCTLTELHTHIHDNDGIMRMRKVNTFALPEGKKTALKRGGDHIMCMNATNDFKQGKMATLSLTFQNSKKERNTITVLVPIRDAA